MTPASPPNAIEDAFQDIVATVKPKLRGWLHLAMFPLALLGGLGLMIIAPTGAARWAALIFTLTAGLRFGISALSHRGNWSPKAEVFLKRFDHSNIFLIIAGTYTPFGMLLLPPSSGRTMLTIVWLGALGGVLFRLLWVHAPRWLYVPIYCSLGWVAVFYFPDLWRSGGTLIAVLVAVGGLFYTLGAIVYGIKRPNPSPKWFGFHEIFLALTLAAFAAHFTAVVLVVRAAAPVA